MTLKAKNENLKSFGNALVEESESSTLNLNDSIERLYFMICLNFHHNVFVLLHYSDYFQFASALTRYIIVNHTVRRTYNHVHNILRLFDG